MLQRSSIAVRSARCPGVVPPRARRPGGIGMLHCRLVQYRTRTSLCRRWHKPLESEIRNRTELEAPCVRSNSTPMDVSDAIKNLGVRIRGFRKEGRLTQRVLASRMNVPRTYISKVEVGRVVPTLATLERVAGALEGTVTDLLSDEAERRADDEAARILADPFLIEIARAVDKLNAVQRPLILRAVNDSAAAVMATTNKNKKSSCPLKHKVALLEHGAAVRHAQQP